MRKAIVFAVLGFLVFPAAVNAQLPTKCYVGLYTSIDRTACCWRPAGEHTWARIEMWVWFLPSTDGLMAAEFALEYPANVVPSVVTYNPSLDIILGLLPAGVSGAFGTCQLAWVWFCHQSFWVTSAEQGLIRMVPHPANGLGYIETATCEMGYPIEAPTILSYLYINHESAPMIGCIDPLEVVIGTESTSWGAIKSLF